MKKRLIKKKVKAMTNSDLYECVAYGDGYWKLFSHIEFDKRFNKGERK